MAFFFALAGCANQSAYAGTDPKKKREEATASVVMYVVGFVCMGWAAWMGW
jgi:hypothetical protein